MAIYRAHYLFVILLFAVASTGSVAATAEEPPLFNAHEVLNLSLLVDFDTLCRPREVEDCQYAPTNLIYKTAEGEARSIPVEIRIRGGWRSRKKHCKVPPLFVRFSAEEVQGTPFAGQELLPLTTHCKSTRGRDYGSAKGSTYEQYVLREYLGYRLFNIIDDKSIRVRLVHILYEEPEKGGSAVTRYAFFSEHFDAMAARHQAEKLPQKSFDHEKIDLSGFDNVALFNFMIGNTDSSIVRQRNVVLIAGDDSRQYPVPFDLDMAGLVDAEYSGVSPRLNFRDTKQRLYLGFCHPKPDFVGLFSRFLANKDAMLALPDAIPGTSYSSQRKARNYLQKFFNILESEEDSKEKIVDVCLPWPPSPDDHTTPPESS